MAQIVNSQQPSTSSRPHNAEKATQALAQSEALCRAQGARMTPIRRRVLEALYNSAKPLGAYDLVDSLSPQGQRIAPITVYRALDFLIEQGLAHRLASQNAYIATFSSAGDRRPTAFLICEGCGDVDEIESSEVAETVVDVLKRQGFQLRARALEIMGRCPGCQDIH